MGRPKQPLIEVARVVEVALEVIDEAGLEGLNMRELGKRLGINPASLYHHFHNKEDILEAVREHIIRKVKVPARMASKPWDEQLMILGKSFRAGLTKHSNAVILVGSTNPARTRMMSHHLYESVVAALLEAGFREQDAILMIVSIEILASGSVVEELSLGSHMRFGEVDATRFPSLNQATRGRPASISSAFPEMLAMFIEGAKARLLAQKPKSPQAKRLKSVKGR